MVKIGRATGLFDETPMRAQRAEVPAASRFARLMGEPYIKGMSSPPTPDQTLSSFTSLAKNHSAKGPPPVHSWNPPFCGDIDMRIASDGTWFYLGTPIGRPALVKLSASILRKDPDRFVLVTPVEMVGITVEDAPFIAIAMEATQDKDGPHIHFRTNVDDIVTAGPDHPLRFAPDTKGGLKPYIRIRGDLWAKVSRAVYYDLVALGEERAIDGQRFFGIASGGSFFPMIDADHLTDL